MPYDLFPNRGVMGLYKAALPWGMLVKPLPFAWEI